MTVKTSNEHGIGTLTLSSPPLNILTRALLRSIRDELDRLGEEPALRVLLLTAEGKHFSAGADVGEHLPPEHERLIPEFLETVRALDAFPLPTVAAVRGRCLGGGFELVQAVDLVVAGEGASFGQPEIVLGVSPPAACALLPMRCGPGLAAELVLTGDPISAERAHQAGLVQRLVTDDRVEATALELATRLARHSAPALRLTKKALKAGAVGHRDAAFAQAQAIYLDELMQTADAVEGLQAFLDKRTPSWQHR